MIDRGEPPVESFFFELRADTCFGHCTERADFQVEEVGEALLEEDTTIEATVRLYKVICRGPTIL